MLNIFQQIGNLIDSIFTIIELLIWVVTGIDDVVVLLTSALDSLISMLEIFPTNVAASLMAVCGGLFVLRVFGRS